MDASREDFNDRHRFPIRLPGTARLRPRIGRRVQQLLRWQQLPSARVPRVPQHASGLLPGTRLRAGVQCVRLGFRTLLRIDRSRRLDGVCDGDRRWRRRSAGDQRFRLARGDRHPDTGPVSGLILGIRSDAFRP